MGDGLEHEGAERAVEREVGLQVAGDPDPATLLVGRRETLERSRGDERAVDRDCLMDQAALCRSRLVVVPHEPCQRSAAVTRTVEHVEQGRVIDLELRHEGFGRRGDELVEHGLVPGDVAPRRLGLDKLARPARIARHLLGSLLVLDDMVGGLHDDETRGVVAGASSAPRDLVQLTRAQQPGDRPVVLGEPRKHDRPQRQVDPDAERVGTDDDTQQAGLREPLHQAAVLGQHPAVMDPDPVMEKARERAAEARSEAEAHNRRGDRLPFRTRRHLCRGECLGVGEHLRLGEVDDIERCLVGCEERLDRLVQRCAAVLEAERNRSGRGAHYRHRPAGAAGQALLDRAHVAERGRHEDELRPDQLQERHLPRPASVGVAVEVELVHHDLVDVRGGPVAKGHVRDDLGGGADDGGRGIDRGVAGQHADVLGAEITAQREELLRYERLDRRGVEGAHPAGKGRDVGAERDEALARAGRRVHDHVRTGEDLEQRFLLGWVELEAPLGRPGEERLEGVVSTPGDRGEIEAGRHGPPTVPRFQLVRGTLSPWRSHESTGGCGRCVPHRRARRRRRCAGPGTSR